MPEPDTSRHDAAVAKHHDAWRAAKDATIAAGNAWNEARAKHRRARTDRSRAATLEASRAAHRTYADACRDLDDIEVMMMADGANI